MEPTELRIDKVWLGPGRGSQLRITHVPSGVSVLGEPGATIDGESFEREKARLVSKLKRKLAEGGQS